MTCPVYPRDLRAAFGKFATGITVITARANGLCCGMTANSFTSVSLHPPMVLVCVANTARTLGHVRSTGAFGVSVLAEHQLEVSNHFAGRSECDDIAFVDLDGVPTIKGALAHFACTLGDVHDAGDHAILVGHVTAFASQDGPPLLYHGGAYRALACHTPSIGDQT